MSENQIQTQGPKAEAEGQPQPDEFTWLDDMDETGLHYCIGTAAQQIRELAGTIHACNKRIIKLSEGGK